MRMAIFAAVAVLGTSAVAAPKASFDCAKSTTPVEKLICSDDGLAAVDVEMAGVFTRLVAAHPGDAPALRQNQRTWLGERSQCTADNNRAANLTCLKDSYRKRMNAMQGNTFLVCGKVQMKGSAFTLVCKTLSNPLQLELVLTGSKNEGGNAQLAKLSVAKAGGKPQVFALDGEFLFDFLDGAIELMDVNFDGFADIKLATAGSAGPNMSYEYWLYDPKAGGFKATKLGDLLSGMDVTADPQTKTVTATGRSNCCSWNASTYGWNGGALKLRTSVDSGEFSPTGLPGVDMMSQQLCGSETKHFNEAGLITRIDVALGSGADFNCEKDELAGQAGLLDKVKKAGAGFKVEAKDKNHFAITFAKPMKPAN